MLKPINAWCVHVFLKSKNRFNQTAAPSQGNSDIENHQTSDILPGFKVEVDACSGHTADDRRAVKHN